jgi:Tol biopolymer transport system component
LRISWNEAAGSPGDEVAGSARWTATTWLSSDGKTILYVAGKQGQPTPEDQIAAREIFAMKVDGTGRTNLTNT